MRLSIPSLGPWPINWFGLITGALMLALPFMGPWWIGRAGTGAMEVALSPFDINMSFLGTPLQSSLVGLFLLFAKISMLIAGMFMILGSIFTRQWWSRKLVRFGVMKPFWSIITLIILLLIGAALFNLVLPSVLPGLASQVGGGAGGVTSENIDINIPYISGTATSTIQMGPATITAPVTLSLTGVFWVAVAVAALGIVTRIYHQRFAPPEKILKPKAAVKPEKAEPEKPKK